MDVSCGFRTPHLGLSPDPGLAVRELHDLTQALAINNPTRDQIAVIKCRVPRYLVELAADDPEMVWAIVQSELRDGVEKKWHEALPADNEHWKRRVGDPIIGRQATGTGGFGGGIATSTPDPTDPTDPTYPNFTPGGGGSSRRGGLNARTIAGLAVGVIALLALIIGGVLLFLKKRKQKRNAATAAGTATVGGPEGPPPHGGAPVMSQYQGKPELDGSAVYPSDQPKPPAAAHIKPELEGTNQFESQYGAVNRPELQGAGGYNYKPPEFDSQQRQQQQYSELPTNPPIPQPYQYTPQSYELDPNAHAQQHIPIPYNSSIPTTPATSTTAYSPHPPASTTSAYPPPIPPSTQSTAPWPPHSRPFSPSQTAVSIGLPSSTASPEYTTPQPISSSSPPQLPTPPAVSGTLPLEEISNLESEARKIAEEIAEGERLQALRKQQADVEARLREARARGQ